ncbi:MAG: hypothetical protein WD847_05410 [Pirellulales bacterium]
MDHAVQIVAAVAAVASTVAVLAMALDIKAIRKRGLIVTTVIVHGSSVRPGGVSSSPAGYGIYVYRSGRWELHEDLSRPGYEPVPPSLNGAYENQTLIKEAVPMSTGEQ